MNVGVSVPLPAYLVDPGFMARTAEELGFESFWCAEHPFIPVQTTSRFPGSDDGVIPDSIDPRRKPLDAVPVWADPRAHRAARVASHVVTSPTE